MGNEESSSSGEREAADVGSGGGMQFFCQNAPESERNTIQSDLAPLRMSVTSQGGAGEALETDGSEVELER